MSEYYTAFGVLTVRRTPQTNGLLEALNHHLATEWPEGHNIVKCQTSSIHLRMDISVAGEANHTTIAEFRSHLHAFKHDCVVGTRFEETWEDESGVIYVGTPEQIDRRVSVHCLLNAVDNLHHLSVLHLERLKKRINHEFHCR